MTAKYTTVAELAQLLHLEHSGDDPWLALCLDAAEHAIDAFCGQSFGPPEETATSRVYVPCDQVVYVDPIASLTGVVVADNGTTISTGLQWEPLNGIGDDGRVRPYDAVGRISGCWYRNGREATVTVTTDQWGWSSVPAAVANTTLELAKDCVLKRENRFGVLTGDFGAIRLRENPQLQMALAGYRSWRTIGIA